MKDARRWAVLAIIIVVPGSCIAASPPKLVKTESRSSELRPAALGAFKLDRTAQQGGLVLGTVPAGTVRLVKDGEEVAFAPDGRFVIGFGRDHTGIAILSAFLKGGETTSERIAVAPRRWAIENLPTVAHHNQPDAEFEARRPGELAQINAARHLAGDMQGWRQQFTWPVRGRISGIFGSQRIYAGQPGAPHNGVDIAGPTGAPVAAPADGVVILAAAAPFTLEGNLLMIDHGMGLNSAFLHLSRIDVKLGDHIRRGQQIGAIGMTGRASGPHLHWGMKWHEERIDPQVLAGAMPGGR